jgi:hypothetical protein
MKAFQVHLNGKRLCLAGVGTDGVLTAIIDHVAGKRNEVHLSVGGLISPTEEHVVWKQLRLKVGDEVLVRVSETAEVDKPKKRYKRDSKQDEKSQKAYVRAAAKKFGWQVLTGVRRSK